jgi:DNA-binding CsgD family transcriptional regulator
VPPISLATNYPQSLSNIDIPVRTLTILEKKNNRAEIMALINQVGQCSTETELRDIVNNIIEGLGASTFVYLIILPSKPDDANENYKYFTGRPSELCSDYHKKMWVLNDPFVNYARTNSEPIAGSRIRTMHIGQSEIRHTAALHGFRSVFFVPTHTSLGSDKRMGLLYIGSHLPEEIGEPLLLNERLYFGVLSMELLLWWNKRLKQQAMHKYSLVDEEIDLLRLSKKLVASDISSILDIKITKVYQKLNRIKEKLDVDKIEQAITFAQSVGLLE